MSFGQSFATGYQVGRDLKKRRAASKFFERFKELTDESEDEAVPTEGAEGKPTAIPPMETAAVGEAAAVTTAAETPSPMGESAPPAPMGESAPTAPTALPTPEGGPAPGAIGPAAASAAPPATTALPTSAPAAEAPAEKNKTDGRDPRRSLDRDHIKELDKLALEAAKASGDMEVYTALRNTTDSFLQGKVLKNLGLAQTAATNGDVDATEKFLKSAYRFVPDGMEAKFERKDGKLYIQDPWGEKGEKVELGPNQIGYIATMLSDPKEWLKMSREEAKERAGAKRADRELAIQEGNLEANRERAKNEATRIANDRSQFVATHALENTKEGRAAAAQKFDDLVKMSEAARNFADAEATNAGKTGAAGGMKPDDMRQYGVSVGNDIEGFLRPQTPADPTNPLAKPGIGPPPKGYEMFVDEGGGINSFGLQAKDLGGAIGIANPEIGPSGAARIGLEITRALADPKGPKLAVSPSRGTVTIPVGGRLVAVKVPEMVMESFVEAAKRQKPEGK